MKNLSDLDLLMILLGSGDKSNPVRAIASNLLDLLDRKGDATREDIDAIKGIGLAKSCVIASALELGRRRNRSTRRQILTSDDAFALLRHYGDRPQEYFLTIDLNGAHEALSVNVVSVGTVTQSIVHPREIFAHAIEERASSIIIAHNHPSGVLVASDADVSTTKKLMIAGELLGIEILDHLIFSEEGFVSMMDKNLL